jgi:hypothetical protein
MAVLFGGLLGTQGAIWLLAVAWFVPWVGRRGLAGEGTQQGILLCFHHGCDVGHDAFLHVRCGRGSGGSGLLDSLTQAGVTFTAGGCRDCVCFEVLLQNFDQVLVLLLFTLRIFFQKLFDHSLEQPAGSECLHEVVDLVAVVSLCFSGLLLCVNFVMLGKNG